jgi:hypothetical protein
MKSAGFGLLLGVTAILAVCCGGTAPASTNSPAESWTPADPVFLKAIDDVVAENLDIGAIQRIDIDEHVVRVDPVAWQTWDAGDKQAFTATVAIYCDQHSANHGKHVTVIDARTGMKLGEYGPDGFRAFQK